VLVWRARHTTCKGPLPNGRLICRNSRCGDGYSRLLRLCFSPLPRNDARAKRSVQRVEVFLGRGELEAKLKVREIRKEAAAHIRFPIDLVGDTNFVSLDLAIYEH